MSDQNNTNNKLIGIYEKKLFRDEKNGWTRFTMRVSGACPYRNKYGSIICFGNIPSYREGTPLEIKGVWQDSGYGMQFNVSSVIEKSISETVTMEYLTGIYPGVGRATAKKIVDKFGADIFSFVQQDNAKELLQTTIANIDAGKLISVIRNNIMDREVYEFIIGFGGSYSSAVKICEQHNDKALKKLKTNPYAVGLKNGLSFETCDKIALNQGMFGFNDNRIEALIMEATYRVNQSGHTYTNLEQIVAYVKYITKRSVYRNNIPASLIAVNIAKNKKLILERAVPIRIYNKSIWLQENQTVHNITRLKNSAKAFGFKQHFIKIAEKELKINYGKKQQEAFELMKSGGVKILTGGPGTGKTTIIKGLINCYKQMMPYNEIALCAPTSRAAQKMSEATGMKVDWQPLFVQNYSEQEITFISVPILPVSECLTSYIPLVLNILKNHGF